MASISMNNAWEIKCKNLLIVDCFYCFIKVLLLISSSFPKQYGSTAMVKVYHMILEVADITSKVLTNDTLPCWVELGIKILFKVLSELLIIVFIFVLLHCEFDCSQFHVFAHIVLNNIYVLVVILSVRRHNFISP